MDKPPSRYDVTVRVAKDDGHCPDPATFAAAASTAASRRSASIISAHTAEEVICVACVAAPDRRRRLPWPLPSSPTRSSLEIRSGHPSGERPVPAVMRRLVEHRPAELVVAAVAGDPDVAHAAAAPGRFPSRLADARRPAHLRHAGPQLMSERAAFRLVLEQRNGHLNDHARASRDASMITAPRSEPGPGGVHPGAVIHTGCADGGGGGQSQHRMGPGPPRPRQPRWPGRLPGRAAGPPRRPVPRRGGSALVRSSMLHLSRRPGFRSDTTHATR